MSSNMARTSNELPSTGNSSDGASKRINRLAFVERFFLALPHGDLTGGPFQRGYLHGSRRRGVRRREQQAAVLERNGTY
jgi:hypothetical protein